MASTAHVHITEQKFVEDSFLAQLSGLGWEVLKLEMKHQKPMDSGRDSFDDVVLLPSLRESLVSTTGSTTNKSNKPSPASPTSPAATCL